MTRTSTAITSRPWECGVVRVAATALLTSAFSVSALGQPADQRSTAESTARMAQASRFATRDLGLGVRGVFGHTDNVARSAGEQRSSSFQGLGIDVDWGKENRRFVAVVQGDVEARRYSADAVLEDDVQIWGSVDSRVVFDLVPERFSWDAEHRYGQARRNPFSMIGPTNRDDVHVLSTGPRLAVPLGSRNLLQAGVTFTESDYKYRTDLEGRTTTAYAALLRQISRSTQVGLRYSTTDRDFDSALAGYEFENTSVMYQKQLASGGVNASIGYGEVSRAGIDSSTAVASFGWNRNIASRSSLSVTASHELTDAGQLFRQTGGMRGGRSNLFDQLGNVGVGNTISDIRWRDVLLTDNPMERSSLGVGFGYGGDRTSWSLHAGVSADRFEADSSFDNDGANLSFTAHRRLNPRWDGRLQVRAWRQRYKAAEQSFNDVLSRVSASRAIGPQLNLELRIDNNRRSRGGNAFDETAYIASLAYRIRP